jgi:hypothetical protein
MAVLRPFRAWRAVPARIDPAALVPGGDEGSRDPRHLGAALRPGPAPAGEEAATRGRFVLAELRRAGLLARDEAPALYVLRLTTGPVTRVGFFAALRVDSLTSVAVAGAAVDGADAGADAGADGAGDHGGEHDVFAAGVAGDAVVVAYADRKGRVTRTLDTETDRDPDATFLLGGTTGELWVVDEPTAAARVTALVEGAEPKVVGGAPLWRLRAQQARPAAGVDDAAAFGLAFFVDDEHPLDEVPSGVVLLPLQGTL